MPPKEKPYQYPSHFGSHRSMVVRDDGHYVVCQDEFGEYTTTADRIDNGLADPNRYRSKRLDKLYEKKK